MSANKQTTIQTLLAMGKSQREIARVTGIDRKTVRTYQLKLAAANSPGVATDLPPGQAEQIPPPRPPAHTSACEPWRQFIEAQLKLKRNAMAIYQDLVDAHGFAHGYNSVKRFVGRLRWREPEQFDRLEFAPGEEAQVDYGEGAPTFDAVTGRWKRPRLFVMTLRYSRRSFRRVVWKSGQKEWARLHEDQHRQDVWRFMRQENVPFTNNLAEQALRMAKVRQKVSGCFRTEHGPHTFSTIRSYLATMHKQGANLFECLLGVFRAQTIEPDFAA